MARGDSARANGTAREHTGLPIQAAVGIMVAAGIALRLRQYLADRSLWFDEAALALNIIDPSIPALTGPLDYDQGAPPAFVALERLIASVMGSGEAALRLLPFLAGVATLLLVYPMGRRFVGRRAALLALGLVALLRPFVYFSTEVKQYSTDVVVTLGLLWLAVRCLEAPRIRDYVALAVAGAAAMWISHAAMIVTAGLGIALFMHALAREARRIPTLVPVLAGTWTASFVPLYLLSLTHLRSNTYLQDFWQTGFAPLRPSPETVRWYHDAAFGVFLDPTGLEAAGLGLFALLVGGWALLQERAHRWKALLLGAPVGVALFLSALRLYPFRDRMILFLAPIFVLVLCRGLVALWDLSRPVGLVATLVVFVTPAALAADAFVEPLTREELRPVLREVEPRLKPGDEVYVYYGANRAFEYYRRLGAVEGIPEEAVTVGGEFRNDWSAYRRELESLEGRGRTWVIFSHVYSLAGADEEELALFVLDELGTRLHSVREPGASAYLYDL